MELDYPERLQRMLLTPQRELSVELVVQMDNGEIEVYNAYRVQHNNSRGPYKVGPLPRQPPRFFAPLTAELTQPAPLSAGRPALSSRRRPG